jgi:hypothetical protein
VQNDNTLGVDGFFLARTFPKEKYFSLHSFFRQDAVIVVIFMSNAKKKKTAFKTLASTWIRLDPSKDVWLLLM